MSDTEADHDQPIHIEITLKLSYQRSISYTPFIKFGSPVPKKLLQQLLYQILERMSHLKNSSRWLKMKPTSFQLNRLVNLVLNAVNTSLLLVRRYVLLGPIITGAESSARLIILLVPIIPSTTQ